MFNIFNLVSSLLPNIFNFAKIGASSGISKSVDLGHSQVGNYIHNMATFISGLVIGFVNCWEIALITLATGPFIVAAGGISNIFLHRLAENIQDAYAEAASIAEQVLY